MVLLQRRCALTVACAYRTVSEPVVLVIVGVVPIRLPAQEKYVYTRKGDVRKKQASQEGRTQNLQLWLLLGCRYTRQMDRDTHTSRGTMGEQRTWGSRLIPLTGPLRTRVLPIVLDQNEESRKSHLPVLRGRKG